MVHSQKASCKCFSVLPCACLNSSHCSHQEPIPSSVRVEHQTNYLMIYKCSHKATLISYHQGSFKGIRPVAQALVSVKRPPNGNTLDNSISQWYSASISSKCNVLKRNLPFHLSNVPYIISGLNGLEQQPS